MRAPTVYLLEEFRFRNPRIGEMLKGWKCYALVEADQVLSTSKLSSKPAIIYCDGLIARRRSAANAELQSITMSSDLAMWWMR